MSRPGLLVPGASLAHMAKRVKGNGFGFPQLLSDGALSASSSRARISASTTSANVLGAWAEVVASLTADVGFVHITIPLPMDGAAGINSSYQLSIGVGAAGSEVVVVDDLAVGWLPQAVTTSDTRGHPGFLLPLFIPRGSRVAIALRSTRFPSTKSFVLNFFAPFTGLKPSNKIQGIGLSTANSRGTVLTTPGAINTKGAWTELTAATAEPFAALAVAIQGGSDTTQAQTEALVDVGVGAAGSEVVVISDIGVSISSSEFMTHLSPLVHSVVIPKGSRIVARCALAALTSTLDVAVHGIRAAA